MRTGLFLLSGMRNGYAINSVLLLLLSIIRLFLVRSVPELSGALSPAETAPPVQDDDKEQLCSSAELTSAEIVFDIDGDAMRIANIYADNRNCSLRRFEGDQAGALSL